MLNGKPNHRWHQKVNWSNDTVPTSTDDVKLLSGTLVEMFSTNAEVKTIDAKIPLKLGSALTITTSGSFENSLTAGADGILRANGPVVFTGFNDFRTTTFQAQMSEDLIAYADVIHTEESAVSTDGLTEYIIHAPALQGVEKTFARLVAKPIVP